jgi:Transposase DDE domain
VVAGGRRRQSCAGDKGGSATGPSPVDRARNGSKHHLLVDATGIPLAWTLTGGNPNDITQLVPLVDRVPPVRGRVGRPRWQEISDEELAAFVVRDLRLLMVGDIRILNKRVIEEAHKRSRQVGVRGQDHSRSDARSCFRTNSSAKPSKSAGMDRHWRTDAYFHDHPHP